MESVVINHSKDVIITTSKELQQITWLEIHQPNFAIISLKRGATGSYGLVFPKNPFNVTK